MLNLLLTQMYDTEDKINESYSLTIYVSNKCANIIHTPVNLLSTHFTRGFNI